MEKKQEIIRIIKKYRDTEYLDVAADEILRLFDVSGSLQAYDPLDDENSEIYKIGREIAEMSDEEFEANCKAISDMLSKSKGNGR